MKIELLIFGITAFFIINTYHDGKYVAILKSWKKYYQMATFAFLGLSLYLFMKRHPNHSRSLLQHANVDMRPGRLINLIFSTSEMNLIVISRSSVIYLLFV